MTKYETASKRFYNGHNVPVLLCLCRSWYAKATKDQSFSAMNTALQYGQKVLIFLALKAYCINDSF